MLKCEDTSGSDEELYDRLSTVHQLQTNLNELKTNGFTSRKDKSDTGSKHALETRLEEIPEMQKQVSNGERVLESIRSHIIGMDKDKIPPKVKEAMERDLSNIKFDFDKFISAIQDVKQGVNVRLRQWADYEAQLEKLTNWLGDSETALENYSHKSSLEEKQEQVE